MSEKINKENFLATLSSMSPQEMAEFISKNGKGPKVIQLVAWAHPESLENNTAITQ